jgi:uncharacterized alpha-E superfamily protein
MLARIARELFWLGRSVARAEHTSRMLEGAFQAALQGSPDHPAGVRFGWGAIAAVLGQDQVAEVHSRDAVVQTLTLDEATPVSIVSCVGRARESARTVRDVISAEMWEAVNTTFLQLNLRRTRSEMEGPDQLLRYVRERAALFWGLTSRTMLRDEARSFLVAGGRFESADMVLRMLQVAVPEDDDGLAHDGHALALLQAVGGFQAYRRAVPAPPNAGPVARFLLFETAYPDSVAASLQAVRQALALAEDPRQTSSPVLRLDRLSADLEFRRLSGGTSLSEVFVAVGDELALVDQDIAEHYFAGATSAPGVVAS